jgi:FkbH-like protein
MTNVIEYNSTILPYSAFSLSNYFLHGCAITGTSYWEIAGLVIDALQGSSETALRKVLVTDCDGVLWDGIVAEDGIEALRFHPEGSGFRHFVYQTYLKRLKENGVLLAAVSRNCLEDVNAALALPGQTLTSDDFVSIDASYKAKSLHIQNLASQLNLGLDSIVFIDDNPVEIAEVNSSLAQVTCLPFPKNENELSNFLDRLSRLFARSTITDEDRQRTELYRLHGITKTDGAGGDTHSFLSGLGMQLKIREVGSDNWGRPLQLINKTNQFNLNGRRLQESELSESLNKGWRLFAARLTDRTGDHGEILACLINTEGIVEALVLSCRVFQRNVEHVFFSWLGDQPDLLKGLRFIATPRNEPLRDFFTDASFNLVNGVIIFDNKKFCETHARKLNTIELNV